MERQERERGVVRLEEQIASLQRAAEERLSSLPPAELAEYKRLLLEKEAVSRDAEVRQGELEQVNSLVAESEEALKRDRVRDEYASGEKRLSLLQAELTGLQDELATSRLDPSAAREKLLLKVKGENARMQAIDREMRAEEEAHESRRRTIAELDKEIEERKGEAGDTAKYEALFKRDAEMTEFIDRMPEVRDKEIAEQRRLQDSILALLEHTSEGILREANLPSQGQTEEMKDDLNEKRRELQASEMTAEQLREHLKLRQTELEKIQKLEANIAIELKSLGEKAAAMQAERPKFADMEGLRSAADEAKSILRAAIEVHASRRDELRGPAANAEREVEKIRQALSSLPQAALLEAGEAQIKALEAQVFGLKECSCVCVCVCVCFSF